MAQKPTYEELGKRIKELEQAESDHKRSEKALRESEDKYRVLIESMKDVIVRLSPTGHLLFVSPGVKEFGGYNSEDEIGNHMLKYLTNKTDIIRATELLDDVLETHHSGRFEFEFKPKDREPFPVELTFFPILGEDGEVKEIQIVLRDLTERKQAEKALRESEDKFRTFFNLSPQSIAITEAETGKLVNLNNMFCEQTKYSRDEVIGKTTTEMGFYSTDDRDRFINELYASGEIRGLKMNFKVKDGSILNTLMFSKLLRIAEEKFILTIFLDITRQQKLEAQLHQAQKMESIGTLAGGIAHDFNNILFPMFGYLEMMMRDAPVDSPLHDSLERVFNGAKIARDLAKQILTFSRQKDHEMKPLKVHLVIKEALELVESFLPSTIEISQNIKTDCRLVMADPTQIHQIVTNLCTNAFHAMEETGGKLTITFKDVELAVKDLKDSVMIPGPYVCLTVADTGQGMKQSIMDRIFEPYFTTKKEGKGTGLGLAILHGIVKSHGGHISFYSEPGKGAEFKVYLPVIKKQKETSKVETDASIQKGNERILLVDDQDIIVQMEKQMLEQLGYHVTGRISSVDVLEMFRADPDKFDLVITDMTMPNMTGEQLADELIKIRSDIPVILCTGFSEMMSEEKAKAMGIKGFLMKPVVMKDLSSTIRKVLDGQ
ncbi:MAG: PAS domain S-box protein [Deltaproteobacteria bacterium]|nr:PAS domain S-box protein [Deltaproteobacteria bacterium]